MNTTKIDRSDWTVEDYLEDQRHTAKAISIMLDLSLNVKITSWLHYDLPWLRDVHVSDQYDALAVQQRLVEHGPSPVLARKSEEKGLCHDCGGYGDSHYLSCPIWHFNQKGI